MAKGFNINVQLLAETQKFNRSMQKVGGTMNNLKGVVAGAFATAAVIGFGKQVLSTAGDFENAMARVSAVSDASARDLKALTGVARKMGATTQYSATQAAGGLQKLAMAGLSVSDQIKALPSVLNLATVGAIELSEASDIATNIMSGFGKKASELEGVIDIMSKTVTKSNTGVLELGEAMAYAAPTAHLMGVSIEQVSTLLATMANNGVKGSRAGTALNSTMLRLASPTKEAAAALDSVGINLDQLAKYVDSGNIIGFFEDLRVKTKSLSASGKGAVLDAVFGKVQAGAVGTILNSTKDQVRALYSEINKSAGTAARIAGKSMGEYTKSIKTLNSAYESLLITLGSGSGANNAVDSLTGIVRALEKIADTIPVVNVAFAGMLAYLGRGYVNGGASGLKDLYTSTKAYAKAQQDVTAQQKAVNAAQSKGLATANAYQKTMNNTANAVYGVNEAKKELANATDSMSVADKKALAHSKAKLKELDKYTDAQKKSYKYISQNLKHSIVVDKAAKAKVRGLKAVAVAEADLKKANHASLVASKQRWRAMSAEAKANRQLAAANSQLATSNVGRLRQLVNLKQGFKGAASAVGSFIGSTLKMVGSMAAITVAIGAISSAISAFSEWRQELDKYNKVSRDYLSNVRSESIGLKLLVESINGVNTKSEVRKNLITQFNSKYGEYIKNLLTEKSTLEDIAEAQIAAGKGIKNKLATDAATKVMELEVAARAKVIKSLTDLTDKQDETGLKSLVLEERFKSLSEGLKEGSKDVADYVAITHTMMNSRGSNIDSLDNERKELVANSSTLQEAIKISKTFNVSLLTIVEALNKTRTETDRIKEGYNGFNKVLQESVDLVEMQYTGLNALERAQSSLNGTGLDTAFYTPKGEDSALQKLYNDLIEAREVLAEAEKAGDAERIVSLGKVVKALQERWDAEVNPKKVTEKDKIKRHIDPIKAPKTDSYTENATKAWTAYNTAISDASKAQRLFGSGVDTSGARIEALKDLIWDLDDGTGKYTETVKLLISQLKLLEGAQKTGSTATEELTFKQQQGKNAMDSINSSINSAATGGFAALGQAMADAATGADSFGESLLKGTMSALGTGLQQIGASLIAYGVAMEAFKKAFTNPFLAVAAGVGLVAAGAVLTNSVGKMSDTGSSKSLQPKQTGSTGGISMINGAGYSSATGSNAGMYNGAPLKVEVEMQGVLKGNDIALSVARTNQKSTRY